jgi:hypothetical protein
MIPAGADPTDDIGYSWRDYQIWHDRFIRYMCIQRREKQQTTFTIYELTLQAEIGGYRGNEQLLRDFILDGMGIYEVITRRVVETLQRENLIEPTGEPNTYRMTDKLKKMCDSGHRGVYG